MVLVGRMKNLKNIKLHKDSIVHLGVDGFKYLFKGFKYFQENGGSIIKLQVNQILGQHDDYFYQILKTIPDLRVLKINNQALSISDC